MSVGFNPKNELVMNQSLKVQEITVSGADQGLYAISGGSTFVYILEPVDKVYLGRCKVDSSNTFTEFQMASMVICDSALLTAGGNKQAIKLVGLAALNPNDVVIVKYSVLEHL